MKQGNYGEKPGGDDYEVHDPDTDNKEGAVGEGGDNDPREKSAGTKGGMEEAGDEEGEKSYGKKGATPQVSKDTGE